MRKILFALLLAIGTTSLFAQDIIITKESGRIDAQVLEISDYEISYKIQSNPNGPVLKIEADKVASILFENGDVYSPQNVVAPTSKTDSQNEDFDVIITQSSERIRAQIIEISDTVIMYKLYGDANGQIYNIKASDVDYIVFANGETYYPEKENTIIGEEEKQHIEPIPITLKTGKVIMFKPGLKLDPPYYGEYELTNKEQIDLMRQTCPDAYKMYRKGIPYLGWGTVVMLSGVGVLTYGLTIDQNKSSSDKLKAKLWTSLGGLLASFGTTLMCIPITSIGMKPYSIFNEQCGNPNYKIPRDVSLSLSLSPTYFGLTLNF